MLWEEQEVAEASQAEVDIVLEVSLVVVTILEAFLAEAIEVVIQADVLVEVVDTMEVVRLQDTWVAGLCIMAQLIVVAIDRLEDTAFIIVIDQ